MSKGLPKQGARALIKAWTDANSEMIKNANKKKTPTKSTPKKGK